MLFNLSWEKNYSFFFSHNIFTLNYISDAVSSEEPLKDNKLEIELHSPIY